MLSGRPLDSSTGLSVGGFNGTVTVTAGAQTDTFQLNGTAAQVLRLSGSPGTISTDQNTTNPFSFGIDTTYADTYTIVAIAPAGWIIGTNAQGGLTITPAPGLQSGTFSIQLTAWPESRPDLVVQDQILVSVTAAQPGISLNVDADPLFTVPYHGAQLPTAFRATIQNDGPAAETYNLTFSNVPSGFTLPNSGTSLTIPAGQMGFVGLYLMPNPGQPLPAPGTQLSFTVTATSTTDSKITQSQSVSFTIPAIDAVTVTSSPTSVNTTPGTAVTDTLTITNAGNVPENGITLTVTTPSGLTLTGLSPVSLAVGQSTTETITLTPAASTPLGSELQTTISGDLRTFRIPPDPDIEPGHRCRRRPERRRSPMRRSPPTFWATPGWLAGWAT